MASPTIEVRAGCRDHAGRREQLRPLQRFSGITAAQRLRIDEVVHQAYIDVNEAGTEAAAATAVVMTAAARLTKPEPPVVMIVDRPFRFAITDLRSGLPLFLGRVTDPTAG